MALTTHCKIIQASLSVKQHLNLMINVCLCSNLSSLPPSLYFRSGVIHFIPAGRSLTLRWDKGVKGRYVTVVLPGTGKNLTLCEVEVYGYLAPTGKYVRCVKHANVCVLSMYLENDSVMWSTITLLHMDQYIKRYHAAIPGPHNRVIGSILLIWYFHATKGLSQSRWGRLGVCRKQMWGGEVHQSSAAPSPKWPLHWFHTL